MNWTAMTELLPLPKAGGGTDEKLVKMLKELRKKVAKKLGVPPYL